MNYVDIVGNDNPPRLRGVIERWEGNFRNDTTGVTGGTFYPCLFRQLYENVDSDLDFSKYNE